MAHARLTPISHRLAEKALRCLFLLLFAATAAATESPRVFDIPAGYAARTLRLFAQQCGQQVLYPVDEVRGIRTHAVHGRFAAHAALEVMLSESGLVAIADPTSGAIAVRRAPNRTASSPPGASAPDSPGASSRSSGKAGADEPIVMLSPFEVRSQSDLGYRAAQSVTATQAAVPIMQLPMSVSAYTGTFIADQKAYDLYDVVKWAPGVHQDNVSPQGWVRFNIRGFTSAAVLRNGFDSFRFIDTTDVERVEVVRGPASLLYGQINPGGVVNYLTKRPQPTPSGSISVSSGTDRYGRVAIDSTGPVPGTEGRLLYRAIAMVEDVQEFKQLSSGQKHLVAPSLTWRIGDRATLHLNYEHFVRRDDMPTSGVILRYNQGVPTGPYGPLPWSFSYAGQGDYQNFTSDAFTAELTAQLAAHLSFRATYSDNYWDMAWRATGYGGTGVLPQGTIDLYYPPSAGLTPADAMYRRNRYEHQWGGGRALQSNLVGDFALGGVKLRAVLGEKYNFDTRYRGIQKNNPNVPGSPLYLPPWDLRDPATWDRTVPFGPDALIPAINTKSTSHASSSYAMIASTALDDRLHVLAGLGHHQLHNDPSHNYMDGTVTPSTDRSADVPQVGALYAFTPAVAGYVSYSESFVSNNNLLRVNNVPTLPAAPSIGRGWEAGVKIDLVSGQLSGTASVYRIEASPTSIISVSTGVDSSGTTLFTDIQGGSQLSRGAEFELLYTPVPALQIIAGFSRCDAAFDRNPLNPTGGPARLPATPDVTFDLWCKYVIPAGPLKGLMLGGGLNYVGTMAYVATAPNVLNPAYTTVDLMAGYRFAAFTRHWDLSLSIKNVGDAHYYASASSWGFPRHAILSLETHF